MNIRECMTENPLTLRPESTVREAAVVMDQVGTGIVPVSEGDRLVGVVTDRDIALRTIGAGRGPDCPVREVMTPDVSRCYDDQDVETVARSMAEMRKRRLPVFDRQGHLVGMFSLGDLAKSGQANIAGRVMSGIVRPEEAYLPPT